MGKIVVAILSGLVAFDIIKVSKYTMYGIAFLLACLQPELFILFAGVKILLWMRDHVKPIELHVHATKEKQIGQKMAYENFDPYR
jgi:hypothetical protein